MNNKNFSILLLGFNKNVNIFSLFGHFNLSVILHDAQHLKVRNFPKTKNLITTILVSRYFGLMHFINPK